MLLIYDLGQINLTWTQLCEDGICCLQISQTNNHYLALEAPEEEDSEHGAVEDVADLALVVVVHQVVVVAVVPADVRLPLLLRLAARLVVRREQVLVVLEPLQRLLGHGPGDTSVYEFIAQIMDQLL